ncbi:hypothetical protein, partial [Vibrio vulnificus]
ALYPNVVNEAISLSLNSDDTLLDVGGGQTQLVPGEFEQQFAHGLAADIDQQLAKLSARSTFEMPVVKGALDPQASRI